MSERKWIEVEVVERLNTMAYAMCVPLEDGENLGHPVSVHPDCLRDAPYYEELRAERDTWKRAARSWEDCSKEIERDRDALRDRVAELEREAKGLVEAGNDIARERDKARREAEELRAENERLRARVEPSAGERAWAAVRESCEEPAPQTQFRVGDVVELPMGAVTLTAYEPPDSDTPLGAETWRWRSHQFEESTGPGYLYSWRDLILERDGVPTDAGLRRLAEKAGYELHLEHDHGAVVSWGEGLVCLQTCAAPKHYLAVAAALREMGGA